MAGVGLCGGFFIRGTAVGAFDRQSWFAAGGFIHTGSREFFGFADGGGFALAVSLLVWAFGRAVVGGGLGWFGVSLPGGGGLRERDHHDPALGALHEHRA